MCALDGFWIGALAGALAAWVIPQLIKDGVREWRDR